MRKQLFTLGFLMLGGLTLGCSAPQMQQPMHYYGPSRLARMALSVIKLDATLEDQAGNAVPGILVSIETPHYREMSHTSRSGYFFATAKFAEDEGIDFHFSSLHIDWTETVTTIPKGVEKITLRFRLENNKTVTLASLDY